MATVTACATLGYAACEVEVALRRIAARGFTRVEITELGSYCRHLPHGEADLPRVRRLVEDLGLRVVALNVSASWSVGEVIHRPDPADAAQARRIVDYAGWFIERAAERGAGVLTFPLGPRVGDDEFDARLGPAARVYRRIAKRAADAGVTLCLESPHLYQLIDTTEHVLRALEMIDHRAVGATVDASHWGIIGYDAQAFFTALGPRLRHVHLRDSAGADTRDYRQDLERTPGRGTVDFAAWGAALDAAGYAGDVTLELEHRHDDVDAIEREFDAGIAHLRSCGWRVDGARE